MLKRKPVASKTVSGNFHPDNPDVYNLLTDEGVARYLRDHPEDAARIETLIEQAKRSMDMPIRPAP